MNPLSPIALRGAGALLVILALFFGFRAIANHYTDVGRAEVQAKWDKDEAARKTAEELAIADRNAENARAKEEQDRANKTITEKYNEINNLRNQLATANRLRVGAAICGQGSASPAKASGAEGGHVSNPGAGLVREDVERDIRTLMIQVEEGFATGRACQAFIRENGFAPATSADGTVSLKPVAEK